MGRPRKTLLLKTDLPAVLERLKDRSLEGWQRQRLFAVRLGIEDSLALPAIAIEVGASPRSISRWFESFREGGIEGVLIRTPHGKGKKSWLKEETKSALRLKLAEGKWRRAEDAREWLEKELGHPVSLSVTYKYLGKVEARLKVPRPVHEKRNPAAAETFRKTLGNQLHQKEIDMEASVHVWIMDEMRFGLQPVTRRIWTLRGVDPVVAVHPRYQWGYTYGALEIGGRGGAEFCNTDGVCLDFTKAFLEQVAQSDPSAYHIVIQDGAGFHFRDGDERLPERIRLVTLPPYSPELNPVERLWDVIKDRICNRVWTSLKELEAGLDEVLREYGTTPELVKSLIGGGWIDSQTNNTSRSVLAV